MTTIVNINKTKKYQKYIGRGSIFGNPYIIGIHGDRNQVIAQYEKWFKFLLKDPVFTTELLKLKNKVLGCFCSAPLPCHGQIIVDYLDNLEDTVYES